MVAGGRCWPRTSEDEEGGTVGDEAGGVQGNAVADGAHSMLAHSEAQVALLGGVLLEVAELLHEGHVGGRQVSGSTPETCTQGASASLPLYIGAMEPFQLVPQSE